MFHDDFHKRFEERKRWIKRIFISILVLTLLAVFAQIGFIYYGYTKIEENGGVQKTLTDILRTVKQIDKESDIPK